MRRNSDIRKHPLGASGIDPEAATALSLAGQLNIGKFPAYIAGIRTFDKYRIFRLHK